MIHVRMSPTVEVGFAFMLGQRQNAGVPLFLKCPLYMISIVFLPSIIHENRDILFIEIYLGSNFFVFFKLY